MSRMVKVTYENVATHLTSFKTLWFSVLQCGEISDQLPMEYRVGLEIYMAVMKRVQWMKTTMMILGTR